MSEAREELAAIAASLRAYVEWQIDSGSVGVPREPRKARDVVEAPVADEADSPAPPPPRAAPARSAAPRESEPAARDLPPITLDAPSAPSPTAKASRPPPAPPAPARALDVVQAEVAACTKCGLSAERKNTVFSRGNPTAAICFIGEAPGADEDAEGVPFVGRAGQKLDEMIAAMGLDPAKDVYVCNIIKCRPPQNRRPEPQEIAECIPYLHEQIASVSPKVIVAMGNTAVSALLGTSIGITKLRGQWKLYKGAVPVMPTYHPSYLIRSGPQQREAKAQAWEDLKAVLAHLGLEPPKRGKR